MSRTKRSHWMREEMRDGVKRTKLRTKKDKTPVYAQFYADGSSEEMPLEEAWKEE